MKRVLSTALLIILIPICLLAQSEEESEMVMYETVMLTPNLGSLMDLQEAMQDHNRTFHNTAPYSAFVFNISSGPNTGKMMYVMGPLSSFGELDSRPSSEEHNEHWIDVVLPLLDDIGTAEYWTMDQDLSNEVEGNYPIHFMRMTSIDQDYSFLIEGALEKISETVKAMDEEMPWILWWNAFQQGSLGRHYAVDWPMNSWGDLDNNPNFRETFEEVHGKPAWDDWGEVMDLVIEDAYDEIWELVPSMSAEMED